MVIKSLGSTWNFLKKTEVIVVLLIFSSVLMGTNMLVTRAISNLSSSDTFETTGGPVARGFIMSYCPYGLQFLKAYIPVIELLGNDADVIVNFVSYAMHDKKELDENNAMYCLQTEQNTKFTTYLRCFVESENSDSCIESTGVNSEALDTCVASLDAEYRITELYNDRSTWSGGRFPQYGVDKDLNTQYGVQGSPTFVLNGKQVSVPRVAESIKQAICAEFDTPPVACNTVLSTASEQPSFGPIGQGGAPTADTQCG